MRVSVESPENRTEQALTERLPDGKFKTGSSGNPGGRPALLRNVQELAREHTGDAIQTLVSIMGNQRAPAAARVAAAIALMDRGWGKAPAHLQIEQPQPDDSPLRAAVALGLEKLFEKMTQMRALPGIIEIVPPQR
jgi:hypothetical protein